MTKGADDEAVGYALVEAIADESTAIGRCEAARLVKIAALYHLNLVRPTC